MYIKAKFTSIPQVTKRVHLNRCKQLMSQTLRQERLQKVIIIMKIKELQYSIF